MTPETLRTLADLLQDPRLQEAALHWETAPVRVVLVGLLGAGKSSLLNALAAAPVAEVGLGGTTAAPRAHAIDGVEVVDTPGVDDLGSALALLDPLLADCDRVVWVVDGTQPVTRREREALELCLRPHTEVAISVSRLDLVEPEEHARVLGRIAHLTAHLAPTEIVRRDLRQLARETPADPTLRPTHLLDPPTSATPRRSALAAPLWAALQAEWRTRVPLRDAGELAIEARGVWREAVDAVRTQLASLAELTPARAERTRVQLQQALDAKLPDAPRIPRPPTWEGPGMWAPLSSPAGLQRRRRALLGGWLAEGEARIAEWATEQAPDPAQVQAERHIRRLLMTDDDRAEGESSGYLPGVSVSEG